MRLILIAIATLVATPVSADEGLEAKLDELETRYQNGSREAKDFEIGEEEANAYLRQQSAVNVASGVESPWVRFEETLAIVGATVDLEKARGSLPDSIIFRLLSGRVPVEVTARVSGENGVGKIDVERVLFAGVELPQSLVAMLVSGPGASKFLPPGFRLGEPFPLPYDLKSIKSRVKALFLTQGPTADSK
jgi:hypothetical protein